MSCSHPSLVILLAVVAAVADGQAYGKGHRPARTAPRHLSHTKVNHYRRPAVHRHAVRSVRRSAPRMARQPVRRSVVRTIHRYPVHRVQRRFARRPYYHGRFSGVRRYTYSYYPRRYLWRTSHYNRGYGSWRRRASRGIGGIVESVLGNGANGTLLVRVIRPRWSRFRYARTNAGAGWGATSLHRFHLNGGTRYEVMTIPPRAGTMADLHRGERVLVLRNANSGNIAQMVRMSPRRGR